jgi:hypothetical protein
VVGATIDHERCRLQLRGECTGFAVWECQDDDVMSVQGFGRRRIELTIGQLDQMPVDLAEPATSARLGGHGANLEFGVLKGEPEHLAARVSARPRDRHRQSHDA